MSGPNPVNRINRRGAVPRGESSLCNCGNHCFSSISKGYVVLVSPEDKDHLSYKWSSFTTKAGYIMVTRSKTVGHLKQRCVTLAREILGLSDSTLVADHIDHNSLDNRRKNIRPATVAENAWNRGAQRNNSLLYKGVSKSGNRFSAQITVNGKRHRLGQHDSAEAAHQAYCAAAAVLHGEFARFE